MTAAPQKNTAQERQRNYKFQIKKKMEKENVFAAHQCGSRAFQFFCFACVFTFTLQSISSSYSIANTPTKEAPMKPKS